MNGPYATEREAVDASLWVADGRQFGMSMEAANLADLAGALSGVDLGDYDRRIIGWLADWEPATVAVIRGLIIRARQAAPDREPGKLAAIRAVLAAFDWERDDRQYALERVEQIVGGSRTASGPEPGGGAHIAPRDLEMLGQVLADAAASVTDPARRDACLALASALGIGAGR